MDKEIKFKVGDLVVLKSGGPKMTVSSVEDSGAFCGCICCTYFNHSELKSVNLISQECVMLFNDQQNNDRFIPDIEPIKKQ